MDHLLSREKKDASRIFL